MPAGTGGSASSLKSTFSPSLDPPVPIAAIWDGFLNEATITWSHNLQPVPVGDITPWVVNFNNFRRPVNGVIIAGNTVVLSTGAPILDLSPDAVRYSPPPFEVVSDTVKPTPAEGFISFPLV